MRDSPRVRYVASKMETAGPSQSSAVFSDDNYDDICPNWLCEVDMKKEPSSDYSDDDDEVCEDYAELTEHDSESEISSVEDADIFTKTLILNNPTEENPSVDTPHKKSRSKDIKDDLILYFWSSLFSKEIIERILECTNQKIAQIREKYNRKHKPELTPIDIDELNSFFGLLLYTGAFKSNDEDISSFFSTDGTGRDIFRCVMSQNRFAIILTCLRFDTKKNSSDAASAISEVFDDFIGNCQKLYTLGPHVCVDELFIGFRGKCRFKMYIPYKPMKYGIKLMCMTDAYTNYLYNCYIYTGKNSDGIGLSENEQMYSKQTQAVLRLAKPIYGSGKNITGDSWFSSIELVKSLEEKGLTYIGALKKNKANISHEFISGKNQKVNSPVFGYMENITYISYKPNKNKTVLLLSTNDATDKSEVITLYNATKSSVDNLDLSCSKYTTRRRAQRWPLAIFFKMIDISVVNSHIAYTIFQDASIGRYDFMKRLAKQLVTAQLRRRLKNERLSKELRACICRVLGCKPEETKFEITDEKLVKRKTCNYCPRSFHRKTCYVCTVCKRPICLQCARKICSDCLL